MERHQLLLPQALHVREEGNHLERDRRPGRGGGVRRQRVLLLQVCFVEEKKLNLFFIFAFFLNLFVI